MKKQFGFAQFGAATLRKAAPALGFVMCMLGPGLSASTQHDAIVNFDVPGRQVTLSAGKLKTRRQIFRCESLSSASRLLDWRRPNRLEIPGTTVWR